MKIGDANGIYHVLETKIKNSKVPLTCVELYDDPAVRKYADTASRVSDYLGHMYRQGLLGRATAPKLPNSTARYAYYWKGWPAPERVKIETPALGHRSTRTTVYKKGNVEISEDGKSIHIDIPTLSISIQVK